MTIELRALADSLVPHLEGFTVVPDDDERPYTHFVRLRHADGRGFTIHANGWNPGTKSGQVHISGDWPKDGDQYRGPREWGVIPYGDTAPTINVSVSRGPEKVAADIARRFLAVYSPLWVRCCNQQAQNDAYRAQVRALGEALRDLLPLSDLRAGDSPLLSIGASSVGVYGELQPNGESVTFRGVSLPVPLALDVARLIGTYITQHTAPETVEAAELLRSEA